MDDLVQWLRVMLDDDEQTARNAMEYGSGKWTFVDTQGGDHKVVDSGGYTITGHYDVDAQPWFAEPHIAEWDPARVLREIEAKRALLNTYTEGVARLDATGLGADMRDVGYSEGLEGAIRVIAVAYVDRQGFRPEWRP